MKKFCLVILLSTMAFASNAVNLVEKEYLAAAQKGDSVAQCQLGLCYRRGKNGVTKDYEKAVYWFRKSAASGNAQAQWELGCAYATGRGVPKDFKQSVQWYRKSAEQGHVPGLWKMGVCYYVGYGVPQDYKQAICWYRKAAEQGDSVSQYSLGKCYQNGYGVKKDIKKALQFYRTAAKRYHKAREAIDELYLSCTASPALLAGGCTQIQSAIQATKKKQGQ